MRVAETLHFSIHTNSMNTSCTSNHTVYDTPKHYQYPATESTKRDTLYAVYSTFTAAPTTPTTNRSL